MAGMTSLPVSLPLAAGLLALLLVFALGAQVVLRSRPPDVPVMRPARAAAPLLARYRGIGRSAVGTVLSAAALLALLALAQSQGGTGNGFGQDRPDDGRRSAAAYQEGRLSLRERGRLPDTLLYRVPADSPVLWRSAYLARYTGQAWLPSDLVGEQQVLGIRDVRPEPSADDPAPAAGATRSDRVRPLPQARAVIAPGLPTRVVLDAEVPVLAAPSAGQLTTAGVPVDYTVTSVLRPGTDDPDAAALRTGAGADPQDPQWLDLPPSVTGRTRELSARLVAGAPDRLAAVLAVERHLRTGYRYTLDSPVPAADADAVDDFLFVSREGFCEQFASAEVVLLRAAGIPARLATGFAGGEQDGATRLVRAREAHAWVEVWFPGHGWVSSDPTAGSVPATGATDRLQELLARYWWVLVVLAAVALAGWFLLRRSRTGAAAAGPPVTGADADRSAALESLHRLEAALRSAGRPRQPAESLARLAVRLEQHPDAAPALDVYQRMAFAPVAPDPAESRWAAEALDRVSEQLVAEAVSRQGAPATAPR